MKPFHSLRIVLFSLVLLLVPSRLHALNEKLKAIDLQIADGQGGGFLSDAEEENPGAFTVANKNDTDGDGAIDTGAGDTDVPGEVDLMQLQVNQFTPYDATEDAEKIVTLTVPGNAKLYKSSDKKAGEEPDRSWKAKDLPKTFWVELTQESSAVRDQVFTLDGDGATDTVKATGVWATFDKAYNTGNSPPADLDDPTEVAGVNQGLGPMLHNGLGNGWSDKWGESAGILLEFKIEPVGLENEAKVKIDLSRQKEFFAGVLIAGNQQWTTQSFLWPTMADMPNDDDPLIYDEDVIPKNKHIYSSDDPATLFDPILPNGSRTFLRGNFLEFVRVAVGVTASRPNSYIDANGANQNASNKGSRASTKEPWLTRQCASTASGAFVFVSGNDTTGKPIRNLIQIGNHEPLSNP